LTTVQDRGPNTGCTTGFSLTKDNNCGKYRVLGDKKVDTLEQRTMGKVARRLVPFLMLCYFFCFLDRVNVGFAALQMNKDLGFTASVFGFGSGILFVTYMLCEAPSNLVLVKVGARRWIARIMVTWGLLASGMAFVTGENSFYTMRALLGAAEAGFFPGILFYLTRWFPGTHRGRVTGLFMALQVPARQ